MFPIPKLRPGQTPSAEDWNALVSALDQLLTVTGTSFGGVGTSRGMGGIQVLDGSLPQVWIRVNGQTANTANYGFLSVFPLGNGAWGNYPIDNSYPWGNLSVGPIAREQNGRKDVPSDGTYIACATIDEVGNGLLFSYGNGPAAVDLKCIGPLANGVYPANVATFHAGNLSYTLSASQVWIRGLNNETLSNGSFYLGTIANGTGNSTLANLPVYDVTSGGSNVTIANATLYLARASIIANLSTHNQTFSQLDISTSLGSEGNFSLHSPTTNFTSPIREQYANVPPKPASGGYYGVGEDVGLLTVPGASGTTQNIVFPIRPSSLFDQGWVTTWDGILGNGNKGVQGTVVFPCADVSNSTTFDASVKEGMAWSGIPATSWPGNESSGVITSSRTSAYYKQHGWTIQNDISPYFGSVQFSFVPPGASTGNASSSFGNCPGFWNGVNALATITAAFAGRFSTFLANGIEVSGASGTNDAGSVFRNGLCIQV